MKRQEYEKVKDLTYLEYCDYLQKKYGKSKYDYMTASWNKNPKVTRTKEGLFAHHKFEDHAIMLGDKEHAVNNPFEWQKAENIIYCDYLEHLYLHILITEYPSPQHNPCEAVGYGGAVNHIMPILNDLYSGYQPTTQWIQNCWDKVKDDIDVYFILVKRLKISALGCPIYKEENLYQSCNANLGNWDISKDSKIFAEIKAL